MSVYREFTGKTVEEALRNAREAFGAGLEDLDFEILTPGTRGVLGMGAEPARIVAAPRAALGGAAPKREAAASQPLPPPPPREDRPRYGDRGGDDRPGYGDRDRGPRTDERFGDRDRGPRPDDRGDRDRGPRRDDRPRTADRAGGAPRGGEGAPRADGAARPEAIAGPAGAGRPAGEGRRDDRAGRERSGTGAGRGPRRDGGDRGPRRDDRARRPSPELSASEVAELTSGRGAFAEHGESEAADASPEALAAGREILEEVMRHLGFDVEVQTVAGDTSRLNVVAEGDEKEALGALIGRKGERLSALQHLVNLMLSRRMGGWTRVLVDVEDYRGRRERQLRDIATRAAARVAETGKMLQLDPMPALERRWVHIALRDHPDVVTQSVGEEPNRRIVVLAREV